MSNNIKYLSMVDLCPKHDDMPTFVQQIGFRPLRNASPEDLPAGAIVVLFHINSCSFETVVVNSYENNMFFYAHHNGNLNNKYWHEAMFGGISLDWYLFKVIS